MASSASPYRSFAKAFTLYHAQYADPGPSTQQLDAPIRLDVVLDEQGGLVAALMDSLEQTLKNHPASDAWDTAGEDEMTGEQHQALLLEHRTWQLLRAVYDNRLSREDPSFEAPSAVAVLRDNPYIPPEDLVQLIVNEDEEISLYAVLVEHLQTRQLFNKPALLEARHGYLPATARRAKSSALPGANVGAGGMPTPPSLDPDFTLRDPQGAGLAGEDATYHGPLLEMLWDLVRHGELDAAIRVCEQGGEPWRGASLMGGRRWTMGGMTADSMEDSGVTALEGNRTRALWKRSCRAIAKNPHLSASERALYAALTSDLPTLLPACHTWEDYLWAHLSARIESRLEARFRELGGFWEEEGRTLGRDDGEAQVGGALDEVFRIISDVQTGEIAAANRNPYFVAQRMIVLGKTDLLLDQFADRLASLDETVSPNLIGPLIRFFAHLILVLRNLGQPVPDLASNSIIEAYLRVLEHEGDHQLVAMYAACLREGSGEESYARFLRTMDPAATKEARLEALNRAKQHNLEVASIARETVRLTLEEAFATIPALSRELPDMSSFATGLTERDVHLIRTIEWLTFTPETNEDALAESNAVARYFLALGQAHAAQALLQSLPADVSDLDLDEDVAELVAEHDDYQKLFGIFAAFEAVDDLAGSAPKHTATKVEQHNWKKSLRAAIDKANAASVDLLTSDWLRLHVPSSSPNASQRRRELRRIRQIFVPTLVLRLHALLMSHQSAYPDLLHTAMALVKVVAREEYHVYEDFLGDGAPQPPASVRKGASDIGPMKKGAWRLEVYLDRVRDLGLKSLEMGESIFAVPAAQ